jgi:hypothetical protein
MTKTLRDYVDETLTHDLIERINFRYGPMPVYPAGYGEIARAVRGRRIQFTTARNAHYTAHPQPGQPHQIAIPGHFVVSRDGELWVLPPSELGPYGEADLRGTIVHEATHALQDYQRITLEPRNAEGAAYLAGWVACLQWGYEKLPREARPAERAHAHHHARWLASRFLDRDIGYRIPEAEMRILNGRVPIGSDHLYDFNGI